MGFTAVRRTVSDSAVYYCSLPFPTAATGEIMVDNTVLSVNLGNSNYKN